MKFSKIAVLGALLATTPFALADRMLYGDLSTSGTSTIAKSGTTHVTTITFGLVNTTRTSIHYDQSKGAVIDQDPSQSQDFANFDSSATTYYVPGATSLTQDTSHRYTGRTPAKYAFPGTAWTQADAVTPANPVVLGTPVLLYTVVEGGVTLDLYLTEIDTVYVGVNAVRTGPLANRTAGSAGGFTGLAYITESGNSIKSYGTFTLTNNGVGTGAKTFSADFVNVNPVPEPSSLALLGTGMLSAAGMMFRKRQTV